MESPAKLLNRYGLQAKKSWGQCFLEDPGIVSRIVDRAGIGPQDVVLEIGAGLGALTLVLAAKAHRVVALERDRDLVNVLRSELAHLDNVELVEANALTYDIVQCVDQRPDEAKPGTIRVLGNLPYNISSPLLFRILEQKAWVSDATLMFQKEVADRITAKPGGKEYGIPSVLCQHYADVSRCFVVPSGAFRPRPRVDSSVIRLVIRKEPVTPCEDDVLRAVVRGAFSTRRKTLRNSLMAHFDSATIDQALSATGTDPKRRAESLTVKEFGDLAMAFGALVIGVG